MLLERFGVYISIDKLTDVVYGYATYRFVNLGPRVRVGGLHDDDRRDVFVHWHNPSPLISCISLSTRCMRFFPGNGRTEQDGELLLPHPLSDACHFPGSAVQRNDSFCTVGCYSGVRVSCRTLLLLLE
jgi:hypothetical protein